LTSTKHEVVEGRVMIHKMNIAMIVGRRVDDEGEAKKREQTRNGLHLVSRIRSLSGS
jgi:uncharacterized protein YacL